MWTASEHFVEIEVLVKIVEIEVLVEIVETEDLMAIIEIDILLEITSKESLRRKEFDGYNNDFGAIERREGKCCEYVLYEKKYCNVFVMYLCYLIVKIVVLGQSTNLTNLIGFTGENSFRGFGRDRA